MKTTIKALVSAAVLAFFLLIAWATSYPDDYPYPVYTEFLIINQSDSCKVKELSYVFKARRDNLDTLNSFPVTIEPGDSLWAAQEGQRYEKLLYACYCPDTLFVQEVDIEVDTNFIAELIIGCE
jgi:hypothetical protein